MVSSPVKWVQWLILWPMRSAPHRAMRGWCCQGCLQGKVNQRDGTYRPTLIIQIYMNLLYCAKGYKMNQKYKKEEKCSPLSSLPSFSTLSSFSESLFQPSAEGNSSPASLESKADVERYHILYVDIVGKQRISGPHVFSPRNPPCSGHRNGPCTSLFHDTAPYWKYG